ncbi:hypothetical protein NQ318_001601 [Aromia moschata]|uniref:Transmembrane protein 50A n=1 Tax=Aromia moschata TaxID=1265417 RepID=A0AAV8Y0Z4_9CUCU|nr:hypothetical protein NQ318_001601 [Aromia moschata]
MGVCNCVYFENINVPSCVWFEGDKRNTYASILAALFFFAGWWIIIDAASVYKNVLPGYYVCGIVGTLSLIMVNSISNAQMRGDTYEGGCLGSCGARAWLFVGFVMGICVCDRIFWGTLFPFHENRLMTIGLE